MTFALGLTGKRAVVVGAGFGMGRDSALTLAAAGASVMCVDIDEERAANVAEEVRAAGGTAASFAGDMTSREAVEVLRDETASRFGGAEVVVDVVGQAFKGGILDTSDDVWERNFVMNLRHGYLVTQVFARHMREHDIKGSFVHIGSATGFIPQTGSVAYSAAKSALISMIQASAVELAPYSIRINGIAPGVLDTPRRRAEFTPESIAASLRNVPMGRFGTTQEIANLVVFLASELSSYVTGQMYLMDGGAMCNSPFPSALSSPSTNAK